jgi:hypothetical protein
MDKNSMFLDFITPVKRNNSIFHLTLKLNTIYSYNTEATVSPLTVVEDIKTA